MKNLTKMSFVVAGAALLWIICSGILVSIAYSQIIVEPFGFSDSYYTTNGVPPVALGMRANGADANSEFGYPFNTDKFENVHLLEVTIGYGAWGEILYYVVPSKIFYPDVISPLAKAIADISLVYIFTKADGAEFMPNFDNRRQNNIFDTAGRGYYPQANPLALWRMKFVRYVELDEVTFSEVGALLLGVTEAAFDLWFGLLPPNWQIFVQTFINQRVIHANMRIEQLIDFRMAEGLVHGVDLDGTPIIKTLAQLNQYEALHLIEIRDMIDAKALGFDTPPFWYVPCPVIALDDLLGGNEFILDVGDQILGEEG